MNDDDRELKDRFARLRHEDRSSVPTFRAPVVGRTARPAWLIPIAVAAAIALIVFVTARPDGSADPSLHVDLGAASWRSPTDFLLDTPGREMLRRVPAVGAPDEWAPIDLRNRTPQPESTRSQRVPS